jgi:hypothetical protein
MRHYAAFVVLFLATIAGVFAQDGAPTTATSTAAPTWSVSWNGKLAPNYFGSILCGVFADQLVFQEEIDLARRVGEKTTVTGMIWNSKGFHDSFHTFADETDAGIGISRKVGAFTVSGSGWIFFLYPGAGTDALILDGKISRTFTHAGNTLTPYIEIQHDGVTNKDVGYHGGTYPMAGISYERKLCGRFSLAALYHENWDVDGGFGKKKGSNLFYSEAEVRFAATESFTIAPGVVYGGSWDDHERPHKIMWLVGFSKTF